MKLPEIGVQKPVTTLMFFLAVFVLGTVMLTKLSVDLLPEIEQPTVTVLTTWEGASTEDVEKKVTKVIERALGSVNNLDTLNSTTIEGVSTVTCEFIWGTDLDEASNDIRSNLERVRKVLPDESDPPMLLKYNTSQIPIQFYGITCRESLERLREIIDNEISDPLKRLPGVGSVTLFGGLERQINIQLDPARLAGFGLTLEQVAATLAQENVTLPAGNVKVGRMDYTIRVPGEYQTPEEAGDIVVRAQAGAFVHLRDVAVVADGFAEERRLSKVMDRRAIMMMIQKRSGANTVDVAREVSRELENIRPTLPRDIDFHLIFDTSEQISQSIANVTGTVRWAFVFVVLTALFFLRNLRSALIITLTIPFSLIIAFIFMWTMGWTINIISMASLAIAIGMVVDNAVVVLENISKKVERGTAPREAAMFGSEEVGMAVTASTLTTIVVFVPLIFLKGEAGIMFKQLGGLLTATLVASLVCSLWLTPMLGSVLLRVPEKRRARGRFVEAFHAWSERRFDAVDAGYAKLLHRALRRRKWVVGAAVAVFAGSLLLFKGLGSEYAPEDDAGRLTLLLQTAIGTRVEETAAACQRVLDLALEKAGRENVLVYAYRCGDTGGMGGGGGTHVGRVHLRLVSKLKRRQGAKEIGRAVADVASKWPEIQKINVDTSQAGPGGGEKPIVIEILGFDFDLLQGIAEQVAGIVRTTPGAVDAEISRDSGRPEIHVEIDRTKAAAHGLNVSQVANSMRTLFYGTAATQFHESDEDYDVFMRLDDPYRQTLADIAQAEITTPAGGRVRLDSIARIEERLGPLQIDRKNQERMIQVTADVFGRSSGDVVKDLQKRIGAEIPLPSGVGIHFGGQAEDQAKSFREMGLMLVLGILLVYMVMAAQFESLLDPFLILFSIPFAFTGVAISLTLLRLTVSIMSYIGMILLVGVVVNNAIVLIDYINLLRARGQGLGMAIENAGRSRLRPVLITTLTTSLGMLPMILSRGEGAATWKPMAATISGGLLFSMLVTLVLVPTLYSLVHSRAERRRIAAAEKGVRT
jgi:hydrophobe/amphiphile efflux-1 (HAE1) family protein